MSWLPDELLFGPCTHAMAECFRRGLRVFAAAPELRDLAERDAGLVMLVSLVARLARQFHVSRTHAGNVMQRAEAQGLAISESGLGSYRASPELMPVLMRCYGVIFLTFLTALRTR